MARFVALVAGIGTSVILARTLGPEGRGVYGIATLFASLVLTFSNFGIGPAAAYYVARKKFSPQEVLWNNALLSFVIGIFSILVSLLLLISFGHTLFPGIPVSYLLLALLLVPIELFFSYTNYVLLGSQHIVWFNYAQVAHQTLFLVFLVFALLILKAGVLGSLIARLAAGIVADVIVFSFARAIGDNCKPHFSLEYIKGAVTYGAQAHLANVLFFLIFRADMFFVNLFLGPAHVGLYAITVGLTEKIWMLSEAASIVLFPQVAAEIDNVKVTRFTPLVTRTVLWITVLGALVLGLLSHRVVLLLYGEAFLPAVTALQILLGGVVTLSAGRVLGSDIAGRGKPIDNAYRAFAAAATNIALNVLWIPRFGIIGAAWASTVSYTISFLIALFLYCRLSGNRWTKVLLPQRGDWALYWQTGKSLCQWIEAKARAVLRRGKPQ